SHVSIAESVAIAGEDGDHAADAHSAEDWHNGHGFDAKGAADLGIDTRIILGVVAADGFHTGDGEASEGAVEAQHHADVGRIAAAGGAANHIFPFTQRNRCAGGTRERLHALNELADVLEN